ncbi:hypothetical protein GOBAR_AA07617 [Gossypium barbadense]|uniref:Uncharacterized protein n=1 Tax=Gossypium barbadense TaxID=3634 RepID=A0A2P5YBS0_GOSBA|nr:hypothetical protein GOBAR_AA07617 [Gossypium barbadense]
MVEKVAKLDFNTNIRARGQFARMAESCSKADGVMSRSKARVLTPDTLRAKIGTVKGIKAYVQMNQTEPAYEPESLPVFFSNESVTIVETSMSAEIQCATTSHFNLTFKGLVEIGVSMSEGVLDPEKH